MPSYLRPDPKTASILTLPPTALLDSNNSIALWRLCRHLPLRNPEITGQKKPDPGHPFFLPLKAIVTSIGRSYSNKRLSLSPPTAKRDELKGQGSVPGRRAPAHGSGLRTRDGLSPSHRKPASPQMKSEQRWQKVGLVSVTLRKLWPGAAEPKALPVRSGPDPGRARPEMPSTGLPAGLPRRGEPLPGQVRAPGSAAAAIHNPSAPAPGAR